MSNIKKRLINTSVRVDGEKLKLAQEFGIDWPHMCRTNLNRAVLKTLGKCPECHQEYPKKIERSKSV